MRSKVYVGVLPEYPKREVFRSVETPTTETHGKKFGAVIGPFRTRRGAAFCAEFGAGNPHVQCVADAERLAKQLA